MVKFHPADPARFQRALALNWPLLSVLLLGGVVWCGVFRAAAVLLSRTLS